MKKNAHQAGLIECGRIGRPVGLAGLMAVEWFAGKSPVQVGDRIISEFTAGKDVREQTITAQRKQGCSFVIRFDGIEDRESAEKMRGAKLFIEANALPRLAAGEHYTHQIVGLDVVTEEGQLLGKIAGIMNNGSHDIYEVIGAPGLKKEILIPAVEGIILSIDLAAERVIVRPLEGMLEE